MDKFLLEEITAMIDAYDPVDGSPRNPADYLSLTHWVKKEVKDDFNFLQSRTNKKFGKLLNKVLELCIARTKAKYESKAPSQHKAS